MRRDQAGRLQHLLQALGIQRPHGIPVQQLSFIEMSQCSRHKGITGADGIHNGDLRSFDDRRSQGRTGNSAMLAVRHDDEGDTSSVPDRYGLILGKAWVEPGQILPAYLQDVDQPHQSLKAV
jgi:hypothetical protein